MDIHIFSRGFSEQDFNDFQAKHIVYKFQVLDDGGMYVFYKKPQDIGNDAMEEVEQLDRMTKQAQNEILAAELDLAFSNTTLADLKQKISKLHTNEKEWDQVDAKIKAAEVQIKMHEATIVERRGQISAFKDKLLGVLK